MGPFQIIIFIVWALSALALIALVLMHSGKGTGVSDMIASSLYNSGTGSGVLEKNLNRLTVITHHRFRGVCGVRGPLHVLLPAGHCRHLSCRYATSGFVRALALLGTCRSREREGLFSVCEKHA